MVNVVISGIPNDVQLPRFLNFLKRAVLRCKKEVTVLYYDLTDNGYQMSFISDTPKKAAKTKKFLDGFYYIHMNVQYPLECWLENLDEKTEEPNTVRSNGNQPAWKGDKGKKKKKYESQLKANRDMHYEPPQKIPRYTDDKAGSTSQSQSPYQSNELMAIDLKIELVKKQRILMEEENKLLLEKRKLEYLQNFGARDYENLAQFERICQRNDQNEISEFIESAQTAGSPRNKQIKKLPSFVQPCKLISAEMKAAIDSHSDINGETRPLFLNLLRSSMKKRLAVVLEGKGFIPTNNIISMYRAVYPIDTDDQLVDELCRTIKTSCWPRRSDAMAPVKNTNEGQTAEVQNAPSDKEATVVGTDEHDEASFVDDVIDFNEYVDLENDVENWSEDDDKQSFGHIEPSTSADDVKESESPGGNTDPAVAGNTDTSVKGNTDPSIEGNTGPAVARNADPAVGPSSRGFGKLQPVDKATLIVDDAATIA